jgi:hypothetical protein
LSGVALARRSRNFGCTRSARSPGSHAGVRSLRHRRRHSGQSAAESRLGGAEWRGSGSRLELPLLASGPEPALPAWCADPTLLHLLHSAWRIGVVAPWTRTIREWPSA